MSSLKKLRKEYIERASELFPGVTPFIPVINREIFKRYGLFLSKRVCVQVACK